MPNVQPTPAAPHEFNSALALARLRRRHDPASALRHRLVSLLDFMRPLEARLPRTCPGCPIIPGVPDWSVRYPSCEICRWPAVEVGPVHAWICSFCRHWNEHAPRRPHTAAVVLRLRRVSTAARRLPVLGEYFGYAAPRGLEVWRDAAGNRQGAAVRGYVESSRLRRRQRPLYAWARVAGLRVLIVGGDGAEPYPLGLAEHWADLHTVGRWVTRVSCSCGQAAPCVHAQALYRVVVERIELRRQPPGREIA